MNVSASSDSRTFENRRVPPSKCTCSAARAGGTSSGTASGWTPRARIVSAGMATKVSARSRQTDVKKRLSMVRKFPALAAFLPASTRNPAASTTQTPISTRSDFWNTSRNVGWAILPPSEGFWVLGAGKSSPFVSRQTRNPETKTQHPTSSYPPTSDRSAVNRVPVEAADLHVRVGGVADAQGDDAEVADAREDVEHVQARDGEEARAEERRGPRPGPRPPLSRTPAAG